MRNGPDKPKENESEGGVTAVTRALSRVPGVSHVQVDLDTGRAQVAGTASAETLLGAVARAGYDATLAEG